MTITKAIQKVGRGVMDALFPAVCGGCGREGKYVCGNCELFLGEAPLVCPVCNGASFEGERHVYCRGGLNGLTSIWEYEGVAKHLLGEIKYQWKSHIVEELVSHAFRTMANDKERFSKFLSFLFAEDTAITFIPIYRRKEKFRGFNQAQLIAREMGKIAGKQALPLLRKTRDTKSQTELGKEERQENVRESFEMKFTRSSDRVPRRMTGQIPNKVILVDDIWTTGATMKECCKVLRKAGVKEVWGFTLARTV